jgi:hypothetical protein
VIRRLRRLHRGTLPTSPDQLWEDALRSAGLGEPLVLMRLHDCICSVHRDRTDRLVALDASADSAGTVAFTKELVIADPSARRTFVVGEIEAGVSDVVVNDGRVAHRALLGKGAWIAHLPHADCVDVIVRLHRSSGIEEIVIRQPPE